MCIKRALIVLFCSFLFIPIASAQEVVQINEEEAFEGFEDIIGLYVVTEPFIAIAVDPCEQAKKDAYDLSQEISDYCNAAKESMCQSFDAEEFAEIVADFEEARARMGKECPNDLAPYALPELCDQCAEITEDGKIDENEQQLLEIEQQIEELKRKAAQLREKIEANR